MKIKIKKDVLFKAMQRVGSTVSSRNTLPLLANVLIEAAEGSIKLTGTDLEIRIETTVTAEVIEEGKTTLPAKKLITLISKCRGEEVLIESNENYHSKIKCGTTSVMLLGLDPSDYPQQNEMTVKRSFKLKQADLATIIDRIMYAAANSQDSRTYLQGLLFSIKDGKFTAVATDGKRLALCEKLFDYEEGTEETDGDIIVTLKSATELKRLMEKEGEVEVQISENQVLFRLSDTILISKLIDGNYPNYRPIIPSSYKQVISVPRDSVQYAIDLLMSTFGESTSPSIRLTFGENNLLFEVNSNIGEGKEEVPIQYEGEPISVQFNTSFLLEPFRHLDNDNVFIKLNDVMSPVTVESGDGFLYIIMPMRNK